MTRYYFGCALAALLFAGCAERDSDSAKNERTTVYTVNYPLAYFAERIAGDEIDVVFPEMEGDPAFWNPSAEDIARFQEADLILLNGADYAKWVPKASLPQARLVNTSAAFSDAFIALKGGGTHTHGPGGAHAHGDLAFTTWLDPELAVKQATATRDALAPSADGLADLIADLERLDADLKQAFAKWDGQPLVGSHPVYQYLARAYDLDMESVHWEPDAEPDAAMWRELEDVLEAHPAKIMLWEGEPLPAVKAALAERGIRSVVFDPCGNRSDEGDYFSVMNANVARLAE